MDASARIRPQRHHGDHANPDAVLARRHEAARAVEDAEVLRHAADLEHLPDRHVRQARDVAAETHDAALDRAAKLVQEQRRQARAARLSRQARA